jgi:UPF0176 protein
MPPGAMATGMDNRVRRLPEPVTVATLYRFARFDDCEALRTPLRSICEKHGVRGTLLLAAEGINGTIAGSAEAVATVLTHIRALPECATLDAKLSSAVDMPFLRMKVRIKSEIVTMGEPGVDPRTSAGTYVEAEEWNDLILDPDTIVIDARNKYEVSVGTFAGAINPNTASFRDFPAWFRNARDELLGNAKQPRVAMFCTGLPQAGRSRAGAPLERWYPEISGSGAPGSQPVARRVLRVRRAGYGRPRTCARQL